jgi:hypothetical protein
LWPATRSASPQAVVHLRSPDYAVSAPASIAWFEFRYVIRNPLLWIMALATFALFVAGMKVDGFDLASEGGLLKNGPYRRPPA